MKFSVFLTVITLYHNIIEKSRKKYKKIEKIIYKNKHRFLYIITKFSIFLYFYIDFIIYKGYNIVRR